MLQLTKNMLFCIEIEKAQAKMNLKEDLRLCFSIELENLKGTIKGQIFKVYSVSYTHLLCKLPHDVIKYMHEALAEIRNDIPCIK